MNLNSISFNYLWFLVIFSMAILLAGIGETTRLESFSIVENNILQQNQTPVDLWADYEEFKTTYIFTNEPAIYLLNFLGLIGFLYLTYHAWELGRESPELSLSDVAITFNVFLIILLYIVGVIFDYLVNVFVDQLIIVLFNEIYTSVYMFQILINFFPGFIIFSYLVCWLANQITHFDTFNNQ